MPPPPPPEPHRGALEFGPFQGTFPPWSAPWPAQAFTTLVPGGSRLAMVGCAGRQALRKAGTCFDLLLAACGSKRRPWRSLGGVLCVVDGVAWW